MPPGLPRPKPRVLERSVEIDAPVARVFRFHLDVRNLPRISPPGTRFHSIDGSFPVKDGDVVTVRVEAPPVPIPQTWRIRIEAVVRDQAIVDVGLQTPFAAWRHEHRFQAVGPARTRMTDRLTYELPFGPLGQMADRLLVRKQLEKLFATRQANTKTLLESA